MTAVLRDHARRIWHAAVDAVRPQPLVRRALADLAEVLRNAPRILVLGGGKAGSAMAEAVETALANQLDRVEGVVNVPTDAVRPLKKIRLHAARPAATNFPTAEGVTGSTRDVLRPREKLPARMATSRCVLLSGGGSASFARLPRADGVSLGRQARRHQAAATTAGRRFINEMNAVRKHLSARSKGGRFAAFCRQGGAYSLIISDVIGDPLDVIASGPTAADPTTFADAARRCWIAITCARRRRHRY